MEKDKSTKKDDAWAKKHGYILQRDSCPKCIERWERGDKTRFGSTMFCSMGHAYEVSTLKKAELFRSYREELLGAIDSKIMTREKAKELVERIENRYY